MSFGVDVSFGDDETVIGQSTSNNEPRHPVFGTVDEDDALDPVSINIGEMRETSSTDTIVSDRSRVCK